MLVMNFYNNFNDLYRTQSNAVKPVHNYVWQNYGFYGIPESQTLWLDTDSNDIEHKNSEELCTIFVSSSKVPYEDSSIPTRSGCSVCVSKINKKYIGLVKKAIDQLRNDSSSLWSSTIMNGITPVEMTFDVAFDSDKASQLAWDLDEKVRNLYPTMSKREQKRGMFK